MIGAIIGVVLVIALGGGLATWLLQQQAKERAERAKTDQERTAPEPGSAIDLAYWNSVIQATIGTAQLCSGRPNPVDVAYRLGRAGVADIPAPGHVHEYALPIALAVAVGREDADESEGDNELDDPDAEVTEFATFDDQRGPIVSFRITVELEDGLASRSIAVARLPNAIADKASRRLLLFAANRRSAMSWDAHDMSDLFGGKLQEYFSVNTGHVVGAKKVLTPRMVDHLVTTCADGWMMAGEWLFVHREQAWTQADYAVIYQEMVTFLDLLPPAPRPSNEPLKFRTYLDKWDRELVSLLQAKERGGDRRVADRRSRGERRVAPVEPGAHERGDTIELNTPEIADDFFAGPRVDHFSGEAVAALDEAPLVPPVVSLFSAPSIESSEPPVATDRSIDGLDNGFGDAS